MRVLHTVEFYHPRVGGAERVVQRVSEGLVRRGHRVVVATSWSPDRVEEAHNGVRVVPFKVRGNAARGMTGEVDRYQDWLRGEGFEVVMNYAAQSWPTDAALPVLPELPAVRILATCGFSGLHGFRRLLYRRYYRTMRTQIRVYDALIYHAEGGADAAFGRRYGRGHQVVIPNGADTAEFAVRPTAFRARYGIRPRHLLLHVGNHYRVKGHGDLVRVLRGLRGLDVALAVIGDDPGGWGSCWRACAAAARRDPGLILLRGLPRADVVAAFQEADLVLLPSRFEAAPLVLPEALAAGVPFVSYAVGTAPSLPGGRVVSGPSAMIEAVRELLDDEAGRRALGQTGRAYQRQGLEWDTIVGRYEHLYEQLLTQHGHHGP